MNFYKEFSKKFSKLSRALKFKFRNYSENNSGKETLKESTKYEKTLQKLSKNLKGFTLTTVFGVVVGAISMRYYFFETKKTQNLEVMKDESQIREEGKKYLLKPIKFVEKSYYVERKEHEKRLNNLIGNLNQRKYVIVVGSKGSGKTTLLKHVLNGNKGVVFVNIDGETTLSNFKHKLLDAIKVPIEPWNQSNFLKLILFFR
jgi:ABC-type multidrug transport system fused ATPase/permease subunit